MPELPEVERSRRLLEEKCRNLRIELVEVREQGGGPRDGKEDDIVLEEPSELCECLTGRRILAVRRRGKQLWCELDGTGKHPLFHFGMTGAFTIQGVDAMQYKSFNVDDSQWPPRFTKCELVFETGIRLAFSDPRRLGRILLRADPLKELPLCALARDPMLDPPPFAEFAGLVGQRNAPIKAVLLDQGMVVSGVGNWLADEILYQSAIHPSAKAAMLTEEQLRRVHTELLAVVKTACAVNADSSRFPPGWLFHYRWGKAGRGTCKMPDGNPISFETVAGRTSAIVLAVQKKTCAVTSRKDGCGELKKGKRKTSDEPAEAPTRRTKARKARRRD